MIRTAIALVLSFAAINAAQACGVVGSAYDTDGKPLPHAVLRLTQLPSGAQMFVAANANAAFQFDGLAEGGAYRLDLLGAPTAVTGSHLRTRSVIGRAPDIDCRGEPHVDVRASAD